MSNDNYIELDDINGDFIPTDRLYIDPSGQAFDVTRLTQTSGKYFYDGRALLFDDTGVVETQYADDAYRDVDMADYSSDEESSDDDDRLPRTPSNSQSDALPNPPRARFAPETMNYPKLRDMDLDRFQQNAVQQLPDTIEQRNLIRPQDHFANLAWMHGDYEKRGLTQSLNAQIGYDAEELVLNGATSCNPCRPSDLDYNPTLSIFKETNFDDLPQDAFEILKPGMALAEHIILHLNPKFWVDIACGQRTVDMAETAKTGSRAEILHPVPKMTQAHIDRTTRELQNLGNHLVIQFSRIDGAYACEFSPRLVPNTSTLSQGPTPPLRGTLWSCNQPLPWSSHSPDPRLQPSLIIFNRNFLVAAKSFARQKYPDGAAQLRFTFLFAVNFLHEVAHAFEAKCAMGQYYDLISADRVKAAEEQGEIAPWYLPHLTEARYKDYDVEMGVCFEYETFGCRVGPINSDYAVRYGMQAFLGGGHGGYSKQGLEETSKGRPAAWAIPMGYIEEIFQKSFWEGQVKKRTGLVVPRCGPRAYLMNTTSTMDWREHILESDPMVVAAGLEEEFEGLEPSGKRVKTAHEKETSPMKASTSKVQQQWRQMKLKKARLAATKAWKSTMQVRLESPEPEPTMIPAHADQQCTSQTHDHHRAQHLLTDLISHPNLDPLESYSPPSPTQPSIDDHFSHPSILSSSSNLDPLLVSPADLTPSHRWLLTEELALLRHPTWSTSLFLAKRARLRSPSDMPEIPARLIPTFNPNAWEEETDRKMLRDLREKRPERTVEARRKKEGEEKKVLREQWRVRGEMEEFVVRSGGGVGRIAWMRGDLEEGEGWRGMTMQNFDGEFRARLLGLRERDRQREQERKKEGEMKKDAKPEHRSAPVTNVCAGDATEPGTETDEQASAAQSHQTNTITRYFEPLLPDSLHEKDKRKRKRGSTIDNNKKTQDVPSTVTTTGQLRVVGPWAELL